MELSELKKLSQSIIESTSDNIVKVYVFEVADHRPSDSDINRTAGAPIGVSDDKWPRINGEKMEHAVTLDLETVPLLKERFDSDVRAVALFVSSLNDNEAYQPGNTETQLVTLTNEDLAMGVCGWTPGSDDYNAESRAFIPHEVDFPAKLFAEDIFDLEENNPLIELYDGVGANSFAGEKPIWLQSPEYDKPLILQFDENLVDMNLGDAGIMYVFEDTAFWQCC